jgi:1-acyl-sn-glycerol-3-phosphate acyltransferase
LWRPVSPCGVGCLPRGGPALVGVAATRLIALVGVVAFGFVLLPLLALRRPGVRAFVARLWARGVLAAIGVRVRLRGRLPRGPALLVANHISWLDIVALLAVVPHAMPLAKREIRDWPVIGVLARAGGTLFVDRERPRSLPGAVAEVAGALRGGAVVAGFPEGTTWCGSAGGRFRPALLQAALDAGAPVVPVAIGYAAGGAPTAAAAFVGGDMLWASVCRVLRVRDLTVWLDATAALHPEPDADRRALARIAESAVRAAAPSP